MRTARLLLVSPSMHCSQGVCTCPGMYLLGGVPAWGCTCRGMYLPGGTSLGVYLPGGVPARGVYLPGGVYPPGGVPAWGHTCPGTPPHEQNSWRTLLKILPCPNFVAGGKNGSWTVKNQVEVNTVELRYAWRLSTKTSVIFLYQLPHCPCGKLIDCLQLLCKLFEYIMYVVSSNG